MPNTPAHWRPLRKSPWSWIQVEVGGAIHRGRYRIEGDQLVLEWRGGREATPCGLVRPDVAAMGCLRRQVLGRPIAA